MPESRNFARKNLCDNSVSLKEMQAKTQLAQKLPSPIDEAISEARKLFDPQSTWQEQEFNEWATSFRKQQDDRLLAKIKSNFEALKKYIDSQNNVHAGTFIKAPKEFKDIYFEIQVKYNNNEDYSNEVEILKSICLEFPETVLGTQYSFCTNPLKYDFSKEWCFEA